MTAPRISREWVLRGVWLACGLLLLAIVVALSAYVIAGKQHQITARDRQIADLHSQVGDLTDEVATLTGLIRDANATADNTERRLNASTASQRDLLAWLKRHGIDVPRRFLLVERRIVVRHHRQAAHHVRRHRSSTSGARSTAPSGPGKSGHAPGHTKHPRHGHRHR